MENRFCNHKLSKKECIFISILFVVGILFLVWFIIGYQKNGAYVEITVDGNLCGSYSLSEEKEIPIKVGHTESNRLKISKGTADMIWADCPDKLCVHHKSICHTGETIVCLPNKVVITIKGNANHTMDAVAR